MGIQKDQNKKDHLRICYSSLGKKVVQICAMAMEVERNTQI